MRIGRLPDQVVRLAVLFLLAGAALIAARRVFIPETFGELGHYRAAAVTAVADQPAKYAGWQTCVECHDAQGQAKNASYHRTLSCEVCHGPARAHAEDPESFKPAVPRRRGEACLHCHEYLPSRPTGFPQIIESEHNPMEPCIGCHDPHDPTPPRPPESCAACHAQIARTKSISHHRALDCRTCHETAPQHRENPRSFPPKKPAERGFCGRCHAADAGGPKAIPRVDMGSHGGAYTCWQCHYPHDPET